MDKIIIKNMKIYAYHGVLPQEQIDGQQFIIDVEMFVDLKPAGASDDIKDTVDYSVVYGIIKEINENNKFCLVERLAQRISEELLNTFDKMDKVIIDIKKPSAPIDGEFDWVGVRIERSRDEL